LPRHVVVTGAGTGIGRAIAQRLAGDDVRMTLLARNLDRLEETRPLLEERGAEVLTLSCDVRDREAVDGAFERASSACGPVDVLVANAGVGGPNGPGEPGELGEPGQRDRWSDLVGTNLDGTYHCFRAAQRHLAPGPETRHLIAISSILARIGVPGYTAYCASKAGVLGLVRAMACELAPQGVQVNAVCPGWVDTAMAHEGLEGMAAGQGISKDEAHAQAMQQVPLGRMSAPEDVAGMVAWLASDDARGVTGQGLDMNGGAFMI
jgi:NAD(P)-dependent dehydrogenase (short-subunit alcohol dehydrogenase family)